MYAYPRFWNLASVLVFVAPMELVPVVRGSAVLEVGGEDSFTLDG